MNLYECLHAKKGYAYKSDQVVSDSLINTYPNIDTTRKLRGNSRVTGDVDINIQNNIIDMLVSISARYLLNYKEVAYILLTAKVESGFNPDAAAGTTTAGGLAQGTVGFINDAKNNSKEILGFTLDLNGESIFDAEKGCYALVYSFLLNKKKVSTHYSTSQLDYWMWLYLLHHDGAYSLGKYIDGKHKISKDGRKWADYIIEKLPLVEGLLKSNPVSTSFKLSTGDDTPIANKEYVATISLAQNTSCPSIVSTMNNPLIFFQGKTDGEGKTEAIKALAGAEIVFTILKDNYKKLAMSGSADSSHQPKTEKSKKQKPKLSEVGPSSGTTYTVKSGDTLSAISKMHSTTINDLVKLNGLPNANVLHIGQVLKLSTQKNNDTESQLSINYISRYIPKEVKQAIIKHLGIDNGNAHAAISYSRSHIALPSGSISADIDKNKNVVHIKTTTKPEAVKKKQQPPEKHKTDDKGTAKPTTVKDDFEPVLIFVKGQADEKRVSDKSKNILKSLAKESGAHILYITSTLRTPEEQAQAMYTNIRTRGVESQHYYAKNGRMVVDAGVAAGIEDKDAALDAMIKKIKNLQDMNEIVSRHCVSEDMYSKKNVMDISKTRLGSLGRTLDKVIKEHIKKNKELKYISPYGHAGEPAIHIEIEQ
ncbi:LysM peptidoglycan-binding domain-containing protein [Rahnella woolbedingensis]|uniref:LysM peptidoglycan-binding domain-containing protein n=1 Tax=Rahnella woolbedingensis TaxID=1510574 RepID=A0A419NAQ5_9GAMM|nr:LysM peptidoglycan-binding domain-containing protein [Rahnella woolbedingensis]RJT45063.1 LysM peptidoglycan-binding domain-containing protein [Rahnella woolbedingensis]